MLRRFVLGKWPGAAVRGCSIPGDIPMQISDFTYHRPAGLAEACELLAQLGDTAIPLAGGTEILVDLKEQTRVASHLVSLRDLRELRQITADKLGVHAGALATQTMLMESPAIQKHFPPLAEAAATMAGVQIRNLGTIGGNFCTAVPSADLPPICVAAAASCTIVSKSGSRSVPAQEFFSGARQTVMKQGELLTEVLIPASAWAPGTGAKYCRFERRGASALAVAGVAVWVRMVCERVEECRMVLGAVHPIPYLAPQASAVLVGKSPDQDLFEQAAELASKECCPIDDIRGSAEYRRELIRVLAARALEAACQRALAAGTVNYRSIESILKRGLDRMPLFSETTPEPLPNHEHLRGPEYYN
jgi:carbon-monoxide dehydrogenase medium subunit